jgi:hypothetical protein
MYLAPNLVGDLICWPISLLLFVRLAHARPLAAAAISGLIVAISLFAFVLVARLQVWEWDFLSIPTSFPDLSLPHRFDPEQGPDTAWIRASSALHELGFPTDAFTFDYWGVVPLAVFLPALVLGATTLCAVLIVAARPLLYRPLMLIVERLDASSKTLFDLLSAFLLGLAVLVTAVRILLKAG